MRLGISPALLLSQVEATAPFLFQDGAPATAYGGVLRAWRAAPREPRDLADYYLLLLSAHWATAGTFVPTDVDNAIRHRLWNLELKGEERAAMSESVLAALSWDYGPVTARVVRAPSGQRMSTHEGTWFSVAVGAYAANRAADPAMAERVLEAAAGELAREARVLEELARGDALEFLRACALAAHNLGDLDRVADQWELPKDDALRRRIYDASKPGCAEHRPIFARMARLNTAHMAPENHRHYPLRAPRCLRRRREFLIPVGPFYDDWGRALAGALAPEEAGEVVGALIDGARRLPETVGYARALSGLLEAYPGGMRALEGVLTARDARLLRAGPLKTAASLPRERFEAQWRKKALS
ncbi:MAG TPA: hypothetical protein VNI01_07000 [Elusimicrobiota bacterium]|jgi:hypothetical protein|nr:hypothetical protein [Elusimicrobiota bacterium]